MKLSIVSLIDKINALPPEYKSKGLTEEQYKVIDRIVSDAGWEPEEAAKAMHMRYLLLSDSQRILNKE